MITSLHSVLASLCGVLVLPGSGYLPSFLPLVKPENDLRMFLPSISHEAQLVIDLIGGP